MKANIFFGSCEEKRETNLNYCLCDKEDTLKALDIAQKATKDAKLSPLHRRIDWLNDAANNLEKDKDFFANLLVKEVGKPITFAKIEVQRTIETIRLSASCILGVYGKTIHTDATKSGRKTKAFYQREPVGVVVCITPFNFPLNLIAHKIAPALVSGNSIVLKPTPEAPLCAYHLAKLFINSEFATKDAFSLVYGDALVGETLVKSSIPRVISFTGSVQVGKIITQQAGIKKISLELGGNAATFIDKSADLKYAAKRCVFGAFVNSGQVCISLQRILVHHEVYDEFAKYLHEEVKLIKLGKPEDEDTFLGALINQESVNRANDWIKSAVGEGAVVMCGGTNNELYYEPTIMTQVTPDMKIVCEEVFAPIVSLMSVQNYDEAVNLINSTKYGLQFSIFTNDLSNSTNFIDDVNCGGVVINDVPTLRFDIQPYGGVALSGIGKEGPEFAIEEFTQIKSVVIC